jgi:hypothetical protein
VSAVRFEIQRYEDKKPKTGPGPHFGTNAHWFTVCSNDDEKAALATIRRFAKQSKASYRIQRVERTTIHEVTGGAK